MLCNVMILVSLSGNSISPKDQLNIQKTKLLLYKVMTLIPPGISIIIGRDRQVMGRRWVSLRANGIIVADASPINLNHTMLRNSNIINLGYNLYAKVCLNII